MLYGIVSRDFPKQVISLATAKSARDRHGVFRSALWHSAHSLRDRLLRTPFAQLGCFDVRSPLSFATCQRPTVCFFGNVRVFPNRALPCGFLLTVCKRIGIMDVSLAWSPVLGGPGSAPQRMEARRSEWKGFRFVLPCLALPCLALPRLASPRLASPRLALPCLHRAGRRRRSGVALLRRLALVF